MGFEPTELLHPLVLQPAAIGLTLPIHRKTKFLEVSTSIKNVSRGGLASPVWLSTPLHISSNMWTRFVKHYSFHMKNNSREL